VERIIGRLKFLYLREKNQRLTLLVVTDLFLAKEAIV